MSENYNEAGNPKSESAQLSEKKNGHLVELLIGVGFAAVTTFLTAIWCVGYYGFLMSHRQESSMADGFFALIFGCGLIFYSLFWLASGIIAFRCKKTSVDKRQQTASTVLLLHNILGFLALWASFLVIRFVI